MLDWAERVGLRVPDRMAYGRQGQVGSFPLRFRNDWEPLLWFQERSTEGVMDKWAIAEYVGPWRCGPARRNSSESPSYSIASGRAKNEGLKHRGTIWNYGPIGNGHDDPIADEIGHPARFCLRFAEDAVRCFCPPGGLVVDPFSGSGTTAVAAVRHERRFFGGDLLDRPRDGKPWADVGMERVRRHQ